MSLSAITLPSITTHNGDGKFQKINQLDENRVKINQLDSQLFLSILRLPVHVSGVSTAHHQEVQPYVYNNLYVLFFLDDCLLSWLESNQHNRQSSKKNNKYQLLYTYGCTS